MPESGEVCQPPWRGNTWALAGAEIAVEATVAVVMPAIAQLTRWSPSPRGRAAEYHGGALELRARGRNDRRQVYIRW